MTTMPSNNAFGDILFWGFCKIGGGIEKAGIVWEDHPAWSYRWRKVPTDFANATQFYQKEIEQKSRRIPEPKAGQLNAGLAPLLFIEVEFLVILVR